MKLWPVGGRVAADARARARGVTCLLCQVIPIILQPFCLFHLDSRCTEPAGLKLLLLLRLVVSLPDSLAWVKVSFYTSYNTLGFLTILQLTTADMHPVQ